MTAHVNVFYNLVGGHPMDALAQLQRKLRGYLSHNVVYIGVSTRPRIRARSHGRRDPRWTRLVVLYEAYTAAKAKLLERALIAFARNCSFRVLPTNDGDGGEGVRGAGPFYLYVLLRPR